MNISDLHDMTFPVYVVAEVGYDHYSIRGIFTDIKRAGEYKEDYKNIHGHERYDEVVGERPRMVKYFENTRERLEEDGDFSEEEIVEGIEEERERMKEPPMDDIVIEIYMVNHPREELAGGYITQIDKDGEVVYQGRTTLYDPQSDVGVFKEFSKTGRVLGDDWPGGVKYEGYGVTPDKSLKRALEVREEDLQGDNDE